MPKIRSGGRTDSGSPRSRTKGFRPSGPLADEALKRGKRSYNLWYLYGPKAGGDLVASSDAQAMDIWWRELDPSVRQYSVDSPVPQSKVVSLPDISFTATVKLSDETTQLRDVRSDDLELSGTGGEKARKEAELHEKVACSLGCSYCRVGPAQLRANDLLVANAKVATATLAAARDHSIESQHASLLALMRHSPVWTVGDLLTHVGSEEHALFLAAVFRAVGRGELSSDLHQHRWGKRTRLWVGDGDAKPAAGSLATVAEGNDRDRGVAAPRTEGSSAKRRIERTADARAAMASALERAQRGRAPDWYTRKNIPPEYSDPASWPSADLDAHENAEARERALRLRAALCGYLAGAPVRLLEHAHRISRSEVLRLLNRALEPHPAGGIVGWRALLYGYHHHGYERSAPVLRGPRGGGFAGALQQLFARHPDIPDSLVAVILQQSGPDNTKESHVSVRRAHSAFLKLCAARGLARDQYPFNSSTQALRSIYRFFKAVRESHFTRSAALLGGRGAAKRSKLHSGYEPLLRHTEPYDAVQQDAHSLDVIGSIRIPHPKGSRRIPICRLALQVVIEVETKAILGYSVCLLGRISAQDALVAVQHALSKWKPLELDAPFISYPDGAGFPSGVIPELAGAAWATHYLDNDTAYTSELIAERIRNRIGCAVNWGPVGDWTRRFVVEGVFSVLEKAGFQRLPSTTGSGPKDPRRRQPEQRAIKDEIDYSELIYLVDVALATYNATALESLGYRSPLQLLRERTQSPNCGYLPRYLPPLAWSKADMHVDTESRPVRGNLAQGRRPYVRVDDVMYTNQMLANCPSLIGRPVTVHIDSDDMRHVKAFLPDGQPLGILMAQSGWSRIRHSRQMRKLINRLRKTRQLIRSPGEDWVEAYLHTRTREAAKAAVARPGKVSREATQVADIAHRSGLNIPVVPDPADGSVTATKAPKATTGTTPSAQHRTILPAFLRRPVRRAIL